MSNSTNKLVGELSEIEFTLLLSNHCIEPDTPHLENLKVRKNSLLHQLPSDAIIKALSSSVTASKVFGKSVNQRFKHKWKTVRHTPTGISDIVGKCDKNSNPQDVVIEFDNGLFYGASFKMNKGTYSNNTPKIIDGYWSGRGTSLVDIWKHATAMAGLDGLTSKEIKSRRGDLEVRQLYNMTQDVAAENHCDTFNQSDLATQEDHLMQLLKASPPAIAYDYVDGNNRVSIPFNNMPHHDKIKSAIKYYAVKWKSTVRFFAVMPDGKSEMVCYSEHRCTHGPFVSPQVNTKLP